MSQVAQVAEKENLEPMAEQVITMEHELSLCLFIECSFMPSWHLSFGDVFVIVD
jgi:hypothetical protein